MHRQVALVHLEYQEVLVRLEVLVQQGHQVLVDHLVILMEVLDLPEVQVQVDQVALQEKLMAVLDQVEHQVLILLYMTLLLQFLQVSFMLMVYNKIV